MCETYFRYYWLSKPANIQGKVFIIVSILLVSRYLLVGQKFQIPRQYFHKTFCNTFHEIIKELIRNILRFAGDDFRLLFSTFVFAFLAQLLKFRTLKARERPMRNK